MALGRLILDEERCIGCFACEVACNQENGLPPGTTWIRFSTLGAEGIDGRLRLRHQLHLEDGCTLCGHRLDRGLLPACVHHCMARAIHYAE